MPRKIRELVRDLETAGFVHPNVAKPVPLAGKDGADAKHYQEKAVRIAIEEPKK